MLDSLLALIAPHDCLVCSQEGALLCGDCQGKLPLVAERCYRCHALSSQGRTCPACRKQSPLHTVTAATKYSAAAKDLVWKLKFSHAPAAARCMADTMLDRLVFEDAVLVYVPTATVRARQRGFDQAQLLARLLARKTGLRQKSYLRRVGQARQVGASRHDRIEHLKSAFRVVHAAALQGQHVVLVDDVITSGATLESAARILKAAGAKRVDAIVFAQA